MKERHRLTEEIAQRYRGADRKKKGVILDEFIENTHLNRKYAIHLLAHWGKSTFAQIDGKLVRFKAGRQKPGPRKGKLKYGGYSDPILPLVPKQTCHPFRRKPATLGRKIGMVAGINRNAV